MFRKVLDELHFYSSKAEGLFKIIFITMSCGGGVIIPKHGEEVEVNRAVATSLYLFSMALIMEFVVKLVVAYSIIEKMIPFLIVVPSIIAFIYSGTELFGNPLPFVTYKMACICVVIPQVVIWIDVWIQILVEKPKKRPIYTTLRDLKMEE